MGLEDNRLGIREKHLTLNFARTETIRCGHSYKYSLHGGMAAGIRPVREKRLRAGGIYHRILRLQLQLRRRVL